MRGHTYIYIYISYEFRRNESPTDEAGGARFPALQLGMPLLIELLFRTYMY